MSTILQKSEFLWDRFGFNHFKRRMNEDTKVVGSSKKNYIDALAIALQNSSTLNLHMEKLCLEAQLLGTRQVELFIVNDKKDRSYLTSFLNNIVTTTNSDISSSYPFPLRDKAALSRVSGLHFLRKASVSLGNISYQCVIVSTVTDKVVKSPANKYLNAMGKKKHTSGAEFFVEEKEYRQHFHAMLWNESKGHFIISVDRTDGLSISDCRDELYRLRTYVNQHSKADIGKAKNVFGAIDPLYKAVDGYITKLGILTTQSNPVRLKLGSNEECIKKDQYHSLGETHGHVHTRFSVAKRWLKKLNDGNSIEVTIELPGSPSQLDTGVPLSDFSIHKCARLEDIQFSLGTVYPHAS
ncbi:TPA: hypothetical protein ACX3HW_001910 [Vibrio parahaemolyticus]